MSILEKALQMLEKHPLCNHCLGRQFAMLGHGVENDERGKSIKNVLTFDAHVAALSGNREGDKVLEILASNGFSNTAKEVLDKLKCGTVTMRSESECFLCEGKFADINDMAKKALQLLSQYEYSSFLVGTELPIALAEREDEFKAEFEITCGENIRNEFGRLTGKRIAEDIDREVDFKKPDVVVLINPFSHETRLQINPLFIAGRYKKLVRGIPQSKWFCHNCRGKGCKECNWTGKMYPESVEEIIEKPLLNHTSGVTGFFHASGREDIDARMLGRGRPFVVEISSPKKRVLDLKEMQLEVNASGKNKVQVSNLRFADKTKVRTLKKGESTQKEYRVVMEFEHEISTEEANFLEKKLTNSFLSQRTPIRVMHRRADLTREKYIYDVKVKRLSPRKAEMKVRCQGGLYVKELVTGDEGRTKPSVTELLKNRAKPIKLDVLNVIMKD